ncbi:MAG: 50S ribosomal protein L24 [Deinococcales bacterium]
MHVKTGDTVKVLRGKDRGSKGKVLKVLPKSSEVLVEGVNIAIKAVKPSEENRQGGFIRFEAPIHSSKVQLVDSEGKATRVGSKVVNGKKVRISKKSGVTIEESR